MRWFGVAVIALKPIKVKKDKNRRPEDDVAREIGDADGSDGCPKRSPPEDKAKPEISIAALTTQAKGKLRIAMRLQCGPG